MKLLVILHFSIILTENRYFGSLVKSVKGGFILQYPPSITSLAVRGSLCASVCHSGASMDVLRMDWQMGERHVPPSREPHAYAPS